MFPIPLDPSNVGQTIEDLTRKYCTLWLDLFLQTFKNSTCGLVSSARFAGSLFKRKEDVDFYHSKNSSTMHSDDSTMHRKCRQMGTGEKQDSRTTKPSFETNELSPTKYSNFHQSSPRLIKPLLIIKKPIIQARILPFSNESKEISVYQYLEKVYINTLILISWKSVY